MVVSISPLSCLLNVCLRDLEISAPRDLTVSHSLSPAGQLMAELGWSSGVRVEDWAGPPGPLVTVDITTEIEIWSTDMKTGTDIRQLPLQDTNYSISLSEVSWHSDVILYHSSSVHGERSAPIPLFSSFPLPPPSNIRIR